MVVKVASSALKKVHLHVVERLPVYREEIDLFSNDEGEPHSLHQAISVSGQIAHEIPSWFIPHYTKRGDTVLDLFCGTGTVALEAALLGREVLACDSSALLARIAAAKLAPADITEVTLFLQSVNLRRPIDVDLYRQRFASFYDIDTFRELFNLRAYLNRDGDRVSRFVELLALGLLHGPSAGYFSAYSSPQVSLLPQEQEELNIRRRQVPDYRAVVPRILRRAATLLRDGIPSVLEMISQRSKIRCADPRNLEWIRSGQVDLIMTAPVLPGSSVKAADNWLREWFCAGSLSTRAELHFETGADWTDYMNQTLLEAARVTRSGGRCVLCLPEERAAQQSDRIEHALTELVSANLDRYWATECIYRASGKVTQIKDTSKGKGYRFVVLRRD